MKPCKVCGKYFKRINNGHLKHKHNMTTYDYFKRFFGIAFCEICSKELVPQYQKRFCSVSCQNIGHSKDMKGKRNPMYGKHHTEETKQKIGKANSVPRIERICKICKKPFKVTHRQAKQRKHCSKKCGYKASSLRMKMNNPLDIPGVKEKIKRNHHDFSGEKNPFYGKHHTKEAIAKIIEVRSNQRFPSESKIERVLYDSLLSYFSPSDLSRQHPFMSSSVAAIIDIAIPSNKIAIFCDGCYWHACFVCGYKRKGVRGRDKQVNKALKRKGWKVLRFWEHEIEDDPKELAKRVFDHFRVVRKIEVYG